MTDGVVRSLCAQAPTIHYFYGCKSLPSLGLLQCVKCVQIWPWSVTDGGFRSPSKFPKLSIYSWSCIIIYTNHSKIWCGTGHHGCPLACQVWLGSAKWVGPWFTEFQTFVNIAVLRVDSSPSCKCRLWVCSCMPNLALVCLIGIQEPLKFTFLVSWL